MAGASVPNSAFFCWPVPTYLGLIDTMVKAFPDRRDPARIIHAIEDTLRERIFAIGCGYETANDLRLPEKEPRVQNSLWLIARKWWRTALAAPDFAPGKYTGPARVDPRVTRDGGFVVSELLASAKVHHARYR